MKAILWEEDGFLLLYKVLTGYKYQWPRTASEVRQLTRTQYTRLLEGLEIEKKVFKPPKGILLSLEKYTFFLPCQKDFILCVSNI